MLNLDMFVWGRVGIGGHGLSAPAGPCGKLAWTMLI